MREHLTRTVGALAASCNQVRGRETTKLVSSCARASLRIERTYKKPSRRSRRQRCLARPTCAPKNLMQPPIVIQQSGCFCIAPRTRRLLCAAWAVAWLVCLGGAIGFLVSAGDEKHGTIYWIGVACAIAVAAFYVAAAFVCSEKPVQRWTFDPETSVITASMTDRFGGRFAARCLAIETSALIAVTENVRFEPQLLYATCDAMTLRNYQWTAPILYETKWLGCCDFPCHCRRLRRSPAIATVDEYARTFCEKLRWRHFTHSPSCRFPGSAPIARVLMLTLATYLTPGDCLSLRHSSGYFARALCGISLPRQGIRLPLLSAAVACTLAKLRYRRRHRREGDETIRLPRQYAMLCDPRTSEIGLPKLSFAEIGGFYGGVERLSQLQGPELAATLGKPFVPAIRPALSEVGHLSPPPLLAQLLTFDDESFIESLTALGATAATDVSIV